MGKRKLAKIYRYNYITIKKGSVIEYGDCVCDGGVLNKEAILIEDMDVEVVNDTMVEEKKVIETPEYEVENIYKGMLKK